MSDPKITVRIDSSRHFFIEADADSFGQIFAGLNSEEQVNVFRSMVEHMRPHKMQWDYIAIDLEKDGNRDVRDDLSVIFPATNTMLERIAALEAQNEALRDTLSSIALDCQGASVCGEPEMGLETIYHKASEALAAREVAK